MLEFFNVNTLLALFLLQNGVEKCTSARIETYFICMLLLWHLFFSGSNGKEFWVVKGSVQPEM